MISLGCAKNLVDAEIMLGTLMRDGIEITNDATQADVVIVNTCSFIDSAQEESVDAILESARLRDTRNPRQGLVVSGCLPQRFREDLPKLMPEVDAFMGIDQVGQATEIVRQALAHRAQHFASKGRKGKLRRGAAARGAKTKGKSPSPVASTATLQVTVNGAETIPLDARDGAGPLLEVHARPTYIPDYATPRFRLTPRHFAYLKIAEGCNHPCSFCIIPRMRGTHRSRGQADVVREAQALLADGVRELNLISQDTTYYGLDLRAGHSRNIASPAKFRAAASELPPDATTLCSLIRELNALKGEFWIRLLYTHPAHWTDELIGTIAECPKVARYVDMPLQHIHEVMLERMRRETSQEHIVNLIARIRAGIPGIALRTTFIVGFPGETEACFQTLLDFVRETKFERLGVFTYSHEDGTRAASMSGQVPDAVKRERREIVMLEQQKVARAVSEAQVGRVSRVLVEKEADARELKQARISSWEHGLLREPDTSVRRLRGRFLVARGEADAPDIDGRVFVRGRLPVGEFARVRIVGHTDYDLIAEPAID
jgi:ribosomal protein S12 methylthiotransferase